MRAGPAPGEGEIPQLISFPPSGAGRDLARPADLTGQRVAALAAVGRANTEVLAGLFLGPKLPVTGTQNRRYSLVPDS